MKRFVITGLFLLISFLGFPQGEHNIWYFGERAGLDFNSGSPVVLNNCAATFAAWYENFSQCDSLGNLLFYLDEERVFDRNHILMPNGNAPAGWARGRQSSFAVKDQANNNLFYLFTMDGYYGPGHGLGLHMIDMTMNGGTGGIIPGQYRIPVYGGSNTADVLTGIRHQNNKDTWIVVHDYIVSKHFLSYLINASGLDTIPVISEGLFITNNTNNHAEQLRISPDGTKLTLLADTLCEFCQFNTATGVVTPLFGFIVGGNSGSGAQGGAEFSYDSKYLYIHKPNSVIGELYQYNATLTDSALFKQSERLVGINQDYSYLMMGPDHKVYLTEENKDSLSVINNPSLPFPACDFERNAICTQGHITLYGLPQFLQTYYVKISNRDTCDGIPVSFTTIIWPPADSIHWDFGDPASGTSNYSNLASPFHLFFGPGNFTVEIWVRHIDKRTDTSWVVINVPPSPDPELGNDTTVCTGDSVTFDAGFFASCTYLWRNLLTGLPVGTGQTFTAKVAGIYEVAVTDTKDCSGRDTVQMNITPIPVVTNTPPYKTICSGESTNIPIISNAPGATFSWTATLTSGNITGFKPDSGLVINQVLINHNPSSGMVTYHITPKVGSCIGTPSDYVITVNPIDSVKISIAASQNPFCAGASVAFTATPTNGGTTPNYQWKVNGNNAGTNSPNFSYSPQPGDSIWCIMTSNLSCVSSNPAISNKITMVSAPVPVVTFTRCFDSITRINAKSIKLKGGIPLGGTYSGSGVNSTTGVFIPSVAGIGTKTITYSYTNVALCSASKTKTIVVQSAPAFTCGSNLTDIRDSKVYLTVQIGSQCWMAANLNYGTMILSSSHQRDNCIPEKYCYNDMTANCQLGTAVYQWDEIMQYDDTPGLKGLCPPGWHVPTEAEWNTLFANWINNAFAGAPLKYSGYSGFNALLSGVRYLNVQWDYQNFATFFWSSTPYGTYKAWAHGMNDYDPSVAAYPSSRANAYSIRCLRD